MDIWTFQDLKLRFQVYSWQNNMDKQINIHAVSVRNNVTYFSVTSVCSTGTVIEGRNGKWLISTIMKLESKPLGASEIHFFGFPNNLTDIQELQ